jgi:RNA polymerase sigma factor (sigma-70 family)
LSQSLGGGRVERESRSIAFARAYDEHVWDVYGYFAYRIGSRHDAEDLTQLTFERALKAWDRFDARRATAGTWLLAIARNLLVDHYRRDRSRHEEAIGDGEAGELLLGYEELEQPGLGISPDLAAGLELLGRREREVLALRFGGDLTGPEIAELTGLTLSNVQQILSRSLRRLRAGLEQADRSRTRTRA